MTITLMAVLAGIAIPRYFSQSEKGAAAEAIAVLGTIMRAEDRYFDEHNSFWMPPDPTNVCANIPAVNNALGVNLADSCVTTGRRWQYRITPWGTRMRYLAVRWDSNNLAVGLIRLTTGLNGGPALWEGFGTFARGGRLWPFGNG